MHESLTISNVEFEQRLQKVGQEIAQRKLDGLIAFSSYQEREGHVAYLTNHRNSFPNAMTHLGLGHAAVLISASGRKALVAPFGADLQKITPLDHVYTGLSLTTELGKALKELKLESGRLGIAGLDVIPAEYYLHLQKEFPKAVFENANVVLETLRLVKSPAEIELLRCAARAADAGLQSGLGTIRPGACGHEIELAARQAALAAGADFIPRVRVSSGRAIQPLQWPQVSAQKLQDGDLVFLDLIGWAGGYAFDCSRVAVAGRAAPNQQAFLDLMAEATHWMVTGLKPGVENTFYLAEARGCLVTPSGHGIGLEICETPWISSNKPFLAQPGMVLCIEPVVSSPLLGAACIENMVLIRENGAEVLNHLSLS